MNGTGNGGEKPESNKNIIFLVVLTLSVNATVGVCTLSYCILAERKPDVGLFTAFVAIVNYILGVISGSLIKSAPTSASPSEAKIVNSQNEPVPTAPQPKPKETP